jgi:hypothetical protein
VAVPVLGGTERVEGQPHQGVRSEKESGQ